MKERIVSDILQGMLPCLDNAQMERLQDVLQHCLWNVTIVQTDSCAEKHEEQSNE